MSNDRIKVYRFTLSNDRTSGAKNTTRLTIDLDGQFSSVAVEAYVVALDILNRVMHGNTSAKPLKDEELPLSLPDGTRNAKTLLTQAEMLAQALNAIISSEDWLSVNDLVAPVDAEPIEFGSNAPLELKSFRSVSQGS
jgi:hypothetical protein